MLLAGCSTVCTTVAEAAKMWNLVVVSKKFTFNKIMTYVLYRYSINWIKKRFSLV